MNRDELQMILKLHQKWISGGGDGKRANLQEANLQEANLQEANLQEADLRWVCLQGADLQGADLQRANLQEADLQRADLQRADLQEADLRWVCLQGADLRGADLDFSCWPLWCGSLDVKIDKKLFTQLAYHLCRTIVDDAECIAAQNALLPIANQFHRVDECGLIKRNA